ncbi:MAG: hypothetical protein IJ781_09695 [Atopobiaceae bacterium]|nr:hypothetical protein [Atopobiaceae bacterium]
MDFSNLSPELKEKLQEARSDAEACEILVDGGVDVEELERQLSDQELESVSGGWRIGGADVCCVYCGNRDENRTSYQRWASLWIKGYKYRCLECNHYFRIIDGLCYDMGPAN